MGIVIISKIEEIEAMEDTEETKRVMIPALNIKTVVTEPFKNLDIAIMTIGVPFVLITKESRILKRIEEIAAHLMKEEITREALVIVVLLLVASTNLQAPLVDIKDLSTEIMIEEAGMEDLSEKEETLEKVAMVEVAIKEDTHVVETEGPSAEDSEENEADLEVEEVASEDVTMKIMMSLTINHLTMINYAKVQKFMQQLLPLEDMVNSVLAILTIKLLINHLNSKPINNSHFITNQTNTKVVLLSNNNNLITNRNNEIIHLPCNLEVEHFEY